MASSSRPARQHWVQKVIDAQSKRAPEELDAARARIESARQHEVCARKCKAVKGLAVRSRALAAEGLKQMAESRAPQEYAAVQDRWMSAQMASKARQEKKCARLGKARPRGRRGASPGSLGSGSEGSPRRRHRLARKDRGVSPDASGSDCSAASVLRAASDSEEEAMVEAADLVGASDARSMAAIGGEGLALALVAVPNHLDPDEADLASATDGGSASSSDAEDQPAVARAPRTDASAGAVAALLRQLRTEPEEAAECAAKFSLYEGYAAEVGGMRGTLLQFHGEARPTLPPSVAAEMDRQVQGIDSVDAMRIPERSREWFVYHMMRQAERNNLRMAAILEGMEKKLEFLASSDQLECPVCLDPFDSCARAPETLGCCHKVCKECWHNWSQVMRGRPFCPFCRHKDFLGAMARRASGGGEASGSDSDSS